MDMNTLVTASEPGRSMWKSRRFCKFAQLFIF